MRYFLFVFDVIKSCILIILHFIDIQIDETEINANQMKVTVPTIELLEQSKIYHSDVPRVLLGAEERKRREPW